MGDLKETTDQNLQSFVQVSSDSHFPIQNLPYGVFQKMNEKPRIGVAIGEMILDLSEIEKAGYFEDSTVQGGNIFNQSSLNKFMSMGRQAWTEARVIISNLLRHDNPIIRENPALKKKAIIPVNQVKLLMPVQITDYTDFYSSRFHAYNVGLMFRGPDNALQPNWLHLPVAYHGRASSVVVSGVDLKRPKGQIKSNNQVNPTFAPSNSIDYELEMGFFIGTGNNLGTNITLEKASEHIFGMVIVNDWSARDIQKWEYIPLGPFLGKSFGTSISPWVVTLDALDPFRVPGIEQDDPIPLPYLKTLTNWGLDINLEVFIKSKNMKHPFKTCNTNLKYLYWNILQQVAHHTINGCNLQTGDLLATGTISGPTPDSYGSLLETTWNGTKPISLPTGESRTFLEDYDRVIMTGWCQGEKYRVGFGEVSTRILPAI